MSTKRPLSRRNLLRSIGAVGAGAWAGAAGEPAAAAEPAAKTPRERPSPPGATIREPARDVPVVAECDLCVIGGSCTGVFAAVAAARLGARVTLVENLGLFGGVATASLVNIWHSIFDTTGKQQIIGGLTTEVIERLKKRNAVIVSPPSASRHFVFNSAELAIELDELVREAGVRPFLHARFAAPVVEAGRVVAAVIEDKSGRRAIRARYFVDATGDGDLVARIPLPTRTDSAIQPPTTWPGRTRASVSRGPSTIPSSPTRWPAGSSGRPRCRACPGRRWSPAPAFTGPIAATPTN
jgi:ribulose 1,5-bisphosphate synthetase/thiazole synthase